MPERYDLWGSISTLHLGPWKWCYVKHDRIVKMTRPMQDYMNHILYIRYIILICTSCMSISMILNMQNHGRKKPCHKKSVRGHDIASQNTALLRRIHLKIDSNIFSVWSFHYETLNHLLFKRVILLGSSIKATSFQKWLIWRGSCGSRST